MNWGNMIYIKGRFVTNCLDGDIKTTSKKLVWLPDISLTEEMTIISYKSDTPEMINYLTEQDINSCNIGDYIQLLKMNYYILSSEKNDKIIFIEHY